MQTSTVGIHKNIQTALRDAALAQALAGIKTKFVDMRTAAVRDYDDSGDFERLRDYGERVRNLSVRDMPRLLEQFCDNAEAAGATVLWAKDAQAANRLIVDIAKKHGLKMAIKSKSMATEETFLNDALEKAGVEPVETDLGQFILQINNDEKPSHITAPAMHKSRAAVVKLFERDIGDIGDTSIEALTEKARLHLRQKFLQADMGISGANFLLADTGSALIVTNEGNGRMTTTLPRVHVTLAGIDKILPSFSQVAPMLDLLPRSATGQRLTNYVSITTGPRRDGDSEGPEHVYVVLLDNGRSRVRLGDTRDMLRCIRCGACMNHCPVYQTIGGQAYGSIYMGPMGQVLTPALLGVEKTGDMPYAATMCGACEVVCPVKIPLPTLMRRLREERVRKRLPTIGDRLFIAVWSFCARRPRLYAAVTALAVRVLKWLGGENGRIHRLPGVGGWFGGRDLVVSSDKTFRAMWKTLEKETA